MRKKVRMIFLVIILAITSFAVAGILLFLKNKPKGESVSSVLTPYAMKMANGMVVRLNQIEAPMPGSIEERKAFDYLKDLVDGRGVWLEYDRVGLDEKGRLLVWMWVGCESEPVIPPRVVQGVIRQNPIGCKKGRLVNEEMIRTGLVELADDLESGELKYSARIRESLGK